MSDLEKAAKDCYQKQTEPDTSEFECFFHYTDEKLFESGFRKGYELAQQRANGINKTTEGTLHIPIVSNSVCNCINWHPSVKANMGKKSTCSYCGKLRQTDC